MNKRQTEQFKKALKEEFLPFRKPKQSLDKLVSACNDIVQQEGVIFFRTFYPPLREVIGTLYEQEKILTEGWQSKRKIAETLSGIESQKGREARESRMCSYIRSINNQLNSLAMAYLNRVGKAEKPFSVEPVIAILRRHFDCKPIDMLALSLPKQPIEEPKVDDYIRILQKIYSFVEGKVPLSLERFNEIFRVPTKLGNQIESMDFDANKDHNKQFRAIAEKLKADEVYYDRRCDGGARNYSSLLSEFKHLALRCPIAYSSEREAEDFVKREFGIGKVREARRLIIAFNP